MKAVTVRIGVAGKLLDCCTDIMSLKLGDKCILKDIDCVYYVEIVDYLSSKISPCEIKKLPKIFRLMTAEDLIVVQKNAEDIQDKKEIIREHIHKKNLKMKVVDVEYSFDRSKIICYFKSESRVDFRWLLFKLAKIFGLRIELRQIGARDYARLIGGLGICGKKLCCSSHLRKFHKVSIKMAREQNLTSVPENISGMCGKLLCCLAYEYNQYQQLFKNVYSRGTFVETPQGRGVAKDVFLLKQKLKIKISRTVEEMV